MTREFSDSVPAQPRRRRGRKLRRLLLAAAAAAAIGSLILYHLFTDGRLLRERLVNALELGPGWRVDAGAVSFQIWRGLQISDLTVQPADRPEQPMLHIEDAIVRLDVLDLLAGGVNIREVVVAGATLNLMAGAARSEANEYVQEPIRTRWEAIETPIEIEQLNVNLWESAADTYRLRQRWRLRGSGRQEGDAYRIAFREAPSGRQLLEVLGSGAQTRFSLDWMELGAARDLLLTMMPTDPNVQRVAERLDLTGEFRLDYTSGDDASAAEGRLTLRQVSGVLPVEDPNAPTSPYLTYDEVGGELTFGDAGVRGTLHGRLHDATATLDVDVNQVGAASPRGAVRIDIERLTLPTHEHHRAFVDARVLPDPLRAFFDDYEPRGPINLRMDVTLDGDQPPRVVGRAEGLGNRVRYYRFSYPFEDARGVVHFGSDGIQIEKLTARRGSATVTATGRVDEPRHWTGFELNFTVADLPLDAQLYRALPPDYQTLWDATKPLGLADGLVTIRRAPGTPETGPREPEIDVSGWLSTTSFRFGEERVALGTGAIRFDKGAAFLQDVRGDFAGAPLCATASASVSSPTPQWRVSLADLPFRESGGLPAALASNTETDARSVGADAITIDGRVDVWGVQRSPHGSDDRRLITRINDGVLRLWSPEHVWRDAQGWALVDGADREIVELTARRDPAALTITGVLKDDGRRSVPTQMVFAVETPTLERCLHFATPERWWSVLDELALRGAGTVRLMLDQLGEALQFRIRVAAEHMRPAALPIHLTDVDASLQISTDGMNALTATAQRPGGGSIQLDGLSKWSADGAQTELVVAAQNINIDEELVAALPRPLQTTLGKLNPLGVVNAWFDDFLIDTRDGGRVRIQGDLELLSAQLQLGLVLTDFEARFDAHAPRGVWVDGDEVTAEVEFIVLNGKLASRPLENCRGIIRMQPDSPWVLVEDVSGALCGGELRGFGRVHRETGEYQLSVDLFRVDLDQFLDGHDPAASPHHSGATMDAQVHLSGRGAAPASRRGGGRLRIREAQVSGTPLLSSVADVGEERARGLAEFVEVDFDWVGSELRARRLRAKLRGAWMIGEGVWNIASDQIDFTLLAAPADLPGSPLASLLDIARQELSQYRVTGTLRDPRAVAQPLQNLNTALLESIGVD